MQLSLNFGASAPAGPSLTHLHQRLLSAFGPFRSDLRHEPLDQLVKSLISSRTHDEESQATYERLKHRYPQWSAVLDAPPEELRSLLCPVTYPDEKADWLSVALRQIVSKTGVLSLDFLADQPVEQAAAWLSRLSGVGPKVAAAVLNFSTLRMRVMVVDTHVLRLAKRYGLVSPSATAEAASRIMMNLAPDSWTAADFYELHWLMKRTGQMRCTHGWARCGACPLAAACARQDVPERTNVARLHFAKAMRPSSDTRHGRAR
jgi:endonuclease-3